MFVDIANNATTEDVVSAAECYTSATNNGLL